MSMEWKHGQQDANRHQLNIFFFFVNKDFLKEEEEESFIYPNNHLIYNVVNLVLCIQPILEEQWAANMQCPGTNSRS